ncbi:hypothetical protein BD779DRAFT_1516285 [Infundibulicybe gibba]|nr:hypothetical protein BD779DRAFT_1516285 [Infundibulicybe gibba]
MTAMSTSSAAIPSPSHSSNSARTIILCFDGTGNKFGENSNVVRLFHALRKDKPEKQLVYYQPGIGTYNQRRFFTQTVSYCASVLDQAIAIHVHDHVKEGYQFVMQNYRAGDKICLFGFSRGAHTARVVAGMLYKVGILPPHNDQQLDFAFSIYQTTGQKGYELSKEFKQTFARPVTVEFVGVWDTVSSVGIIPQSHPYTSVNYAVKTFRHALALDERRARFRPNTWNEPTLEREQELDVDVPDLKAQSSSSRDDWVFTPPKRDFADIKEVWFAGCHADVGGGSHKNNIKDSLSYIPLRWMIKECFLAKTGILFDYPFLEELGFDLLKFAQELKSAGLDVKELGFDLDASPREEETEEANNQLMSPIDGLLSPHPGYNGITSISSTLAAAVAERLEQDMPRLAGSWKHAIEHIDTTWKNARDHIDSLATIWDQLDLARHWWALEYIPMLGTYQKPDGSWIRKRMRNFGQGRYIPYVGDEIKVHVSVRDRIEATKGNKRKYVPCAYNWEAAVDTGFVKYVA